MTASDLRATAGRASVGHGAGNPTHTPVPQHLPCARRRQRVDAAARSALYAPAARAFGGDGVRDYLLTLQPETGVPVRLRDLGIERDLLKEVVMHARVLAFNPQPVGHADQSAVILAAAR